MNYEEAVTYLFGLRKFGKEPGVVREREALKRLGNPEKSLKIIHVAGTNGKGSVCAYLEGILRGQGFTTGLFTSPHLVRVNERIQINSVEIDDDCFMQAFEQVYAVSQEMRQDGMEGIAFFDFMMAMSMLIFKEAAVDYVVMETGLGGRLDCTSAVEKPVLTVITSISLDHTEILGETIEQIAAEKAGIIRPQIPVVYWADGGDSERVILSQAQKQGAKALAVSKEDISIVKRDRKHIDFLFNNRYYRNSLFSVASAAEYQTHNCAVALAAAGELGLADEEQAVHDAVAVTHWAGRMEELRPGFFVDGAHNADGIRVFLQTAAQIEAEHKYLLFTAVCEKDYDRMIKSICESGIFDGYMITELNSYRALAVDVIEKEFQSYTDKEIKVQQDIGMAVEEAVSRVGENTLWFAAGSLYLVGAVKEVLGSFDGGYRCD